MRRTGTVILSTGEVKVPMKNLLKLDTYRSCEELRLLRPETDCTFDLSGADPEAADLFLRILDGERFEMNESERSEKASVERSEVMSEFERSEVVSRVSENISVSQAEELFDLFETYSLNDEEILTRFPDPEKVQIEGWFSKGLYELYKMGELQLDLPENEGLREHLALESLLHGSYELQDYLPPSLRALVQNPWAFYPNPEVYLAAAYPAPAKERFPIFGEQLQIHQELRSRISKRVQEALGEEAEPFVVRAWLSEQSPILSDSDYPVDIRIFTRPAKFYSESGRLPIPINVWIGLAFANPESEELLNFLEQYHQDQILDDAAGIRSWDPLPDHFYTWGRAAQRRQGDNLPSQGRIQIPKWEPSDALKLGIVPEIEIETIPSLRASEGMSEKEESPYLCSKRMENLLFVMMAANRADVVEFLFQNRPDFVESLKTTFTKTYPDRTGIKDQTFRDGEIWVLRALRQSTPMLKLFLDYGFKPNFQARYLSHALDVANPNKGLFYDEGMQYFVRDVKYRTLLQLAVQRSPEMTRLLLESDNERSVVERVRGDRNERSNDSIRVEGDQDDVMFEENLPLSSYILENNLYDIVPLVDILEEAGVLTLSPDFYPYGLARLHASEIGIPEDYLELLKSLTPSEVILSKRRKNLLFSLLEIFDDPFTYTNSVGSLMRESVYSDVQSGQINAPLSPLEKESLKRLMDFFRYSFDQLVKAGYNPLDLDQDTDSWPPLPHNRRSLLQTPAAYRVPEIFQFLIKRVPELLFSNKETLVETYQDKAMKEALVETYQDKATEEALDALYEANPDLRDLRPIRHLRPCRAPPNFTSIDWDY